jgi:CheY-like chemotaxis protein
MMEKDIIRVCFSTLEPDFGKVVSRALGEGFDIKFEDGGKDGDPAWEEGYDCVLLDLRDLPSGLEMDAGEQHFEKFRRTDFSPPIVVMLGDDDPAVVRRLVEAGAYDVLISPPDIVELRMVLRRAHRLH